MSIYATLHTAPTKSVTTHEMIYITRGASAMLVYPLQFSIEDIEQTTFLFKQSGQVYGYSMFMDPTTKAELNPHFYLDVESEYPAIVFNFDSVETLQFKPGVNIEYEVVIELDTDRFGTVGNKDSVVIEPQHPIAVIDSLYSYVRREANVD